MAKCMCDWPATCGGGGVLRCTGCGGDQCVCGVCAGGGEVECDGCDDCDVVDDCDAEEGARA